MITLCPSDSQIVLYAKGHFSEERTNELDDVRILVANRAGCEPKYVSNRDIVIVLAGLLQDLKLDVSNPRFLESVVFGQFGRDGSNAVINFIHAALALLCNMPVFDTNNNRLVSVQAKDPNALRPLTPA